MVTRPPRATRPATLFPYTSLCRAGDVAQKNATLLGGFPAEQRANRLCELNAIEQAENVCLTTVVQDAWARGQKLSVHGWVYSLHDGRVRELGMDVDSPAVLDTVYRAARSEEHTSELQSLMRISYAVFCLKKKKTNKRRHNYTAT